MIKTCTFVAVLEKGVNATEAVRQINDIEGDDTVNIRQA